MVNWFLKTLEKGFFILKDIYLHEKTKSRCINWTGFIINC
jgi:hypothetical protein